MVDLRLAETRLGDARRELLARGLSLVCRSDCDTPSYTHIETWKRGASVVYLVYEMATLGWDILAPLEGLNDIDLTWRALDRFLEHS